MATKPRTMFRMAPLQKLVVRSIEDPAEQAALDAKLKRLEELAANHQKLSEVTAEENVKSLPLEARGPE